MTAPSPKITVDPRRRAMMAKVQIARKELRLDEPTYRAILDRLTGATSASGLTVTQLAVVLDEFKAKGWKPTVSAGYSRRGPAPAARPAGADSPVAKKARALWISLHQLGAIRDPSEPALEAFARRQLKCERLQWADQGLAYRLIEALKAIARRDGWEAAGDDLTEVMERLVAAQWARLQALGAVDSKGTVGLSSWALRRNITPCLKAHTQWTDQELRAAAAGLGQWIQERLGQKGGPP